MPEVGVLLAALHEARRRTLNWASKISDLDAVSVGQHSAATLLYHVAAIELDWLYAEVRQEHFPAEASEWFPLDVRDSEGRLSVVTGETAERHLARLSWVRGLLDDTYSRMTLEEFRRIRVLEAYDVTPEWVLMHLSLHEAHHEGQLAALDASD
ncbi:hypothetical protein GCM10008957_29200 [Deinococcus ruber]|uniref:DinB-like domain-containing protein n=1 Tax=Deinococcus ruber TaxID=1848197 RepID=A0A918CBB2_9DEIO|nr:hypothetical protein GCM10008957_29200 [Deinococcus ruber]